LLERVYNLLRILEIPMPEGQPKKRRIVIRNDNSPQEVKIIKASNAIEPAMKSPPVSNRVYPRLEQVVPNSRKVPREDLIFVAKNLIVYN
jgi:hypothetical protein